MKGYPKCILLLRFFCYDSLLNLSIDLMQFTFSAGAFTSPNYLFAISGHCDRHSRILFGTCATAQHHSRFLHSETNVGLIISCLQIITPNLSFIIFC